MHNRNIRIRTAAILMTSAILVAGSATGAYAAEQPLPPTAPAPIVTSSEPADPLTESELREQVSDIEDPALREVAGDILERTLATEDEIYSFTVVPYELSASKETAGATTMALPVGCGMGVTVARNSLTVRNTTTSSCTSGNWSTAQHDMRIVATSPFTFEQWTVRSGNATRAAASSFQSSITFTCPNTNLTHWSANSKGYMNKGGVNYETPWVYDTVSSQSCGR